MDKLMKDQHRAVAITGIGAVTPLGESIPAYAESLKEGRSGIIRWKRQYADSYSQIGGDMSDFDAKVHLSQVGADYPAELNRLARKLLRATPQSGQLTACAALQAYVDADLGSDALPPARCAHIMGGHNLNAPYIYANNVTFQREPEYIDSRYGIMHLDTDVLAVISQLLNLRGSNFAVGGACASGNLALLAALDHLRAGRADAILVTGAACPLGPVTRQGWAMIQALAIKSFNDLPEQASRPFDARREGFVPSEGAAAVVLESVDSARRRGASVYGYLLGAASTCNASRLTHPDQDAQMGVMQAALHDAELPPARVNYVNAHATSTPAGDATEVEALRQVFGRHIDRVPVNATKSMVGHCLTSAAIVELVATVIQMAHGFVHPTINLTDPDPALDLDFVPHRARAHQIEVALSNSFGFGGLNASVVVANSL